MLPSRKRMNGCLDMRSIVDEQRRQRAIPLPNSGYNLVDGSDDAFFNVFAILDPNACLPFPPRLLTIYGMNVT